MYYRSQYLVDGSPVGIETTPLRLSVTVPSFLSGGPGKAGFSSARFIIQCSVTDLAGGDGTSTVDVTPKVLYLPSHKGDATKELDISVVDHETDTAGTHSFQLTTVNTSAEVFKHLIRASLNTFIYGMYLDVLFENAGTAYTAGKINCWVTTIGSIGG